MCLSCSTCLVIVPSLKDHGRMAWGTPRPFASILLPMYSKEEPIPVAMVLPWAGNPGSFMTEKLSSEKKDKNMVLQSSHRVIPADILALSHERDTLRKRGHYARADELKQQIEEAGYGIKDNPHGAHLVILPSVEVDGEVYRTVRQMPSLLQIPDRCLFSVNILARNNFEQANCTINLPINLNAREYHQVRTMGIIFD